MEWVGQSRPDIEQPQDGAASESVLATRAVILTTCELYTARDVEGDLRPSSVNRKHCFDRIAKPR